MDDVVRRKSGVHVIHFGWTKANDLRAYLDTVRIAELCAVQAAHA